MTTTHVFNRTYYSDDKPSRVATLWVNRRREDGATIWTGGVTFGMHADGSTLTFAFDGNSWKTTLDVATRATKRRDNSACAELYDLALTHVTTPDVLKKMGVYDAVVSDANKEVWRG